MLIGIYSDVPQSGKSTITDYFVKRKMQRESFAESVKISLLSVLIDLGVENPKDYLWGAKKASYIRQTQCTGGYLMSHYAMFMRNTFGQDIWLNTTLNRMKKDVNYVIDDMRFPNEYGIFDYTVKVVRNGVIKEHGRDETSEGQLSNKYFDYTIENNGTLQDLQDKVETLYYDITGETGC